MNPPSISSFHPSSVNEGKCIGRRAGEPDRRWKPLIYHAIQCKNKPKNGLPLCVSCERRRVTEGSRYLGVVTEMDLPAGSHFAGSAWFFSSVSNGKLTFNGHVIVPIDPEHLLPPSPPPEEEEAQTLRNQIASLTSDLEAARALAAQEAQTLRNQIASLTSDLEAARAFEGELLGKALVVHRAVGSYLDRAGML